MNRWHQLERIIKFYKINSYVELGTWRLRNFGYLYQACPKLKMTGVDLYQPQPNLKEEVGVERYTPGENNLEWNHELYYKQIMEIVKDSNGRVNFIRDYTTEAAKQFKDESIDMVFIDALHTYSGVKQDIKDWTPKVRKGGLICGHDYGYPRFPGVKKAVDEAFGELNISVGAEDVWWIVKE